MSPRRVTLLSDFGTVDGYAAAMAGVIAAAAPTAAIEHASHDVPPGDILTAALTLSRYAFLYPEGTVHLVVVDPGVGTDRRPLAASIRDRLFVAPDNGVLTRVLSGAEASLVAIGGRPEGDSSATFHGRDRFAPAAAALARGEPLHRLGRPVRDPVLLPLSEPVRTGEGITGEVIQVDRFGNLITNVPRDWITGSANIVRVGRGVGGVGGVGGDATAPLRRTYADVAPGELLALIGSLDLLEVSVRDGSAADRLDAGRGAVITVIPERAG